MRDLFLADAHLLDPESANYRRFLGFLESQRGRVRTLFLLGDIFSFWVGYRHAVFSPYIPVLESLRGLKDAGTELVYVEGNHDFHLGPVFAETLGCRILADGGEIDLDGKRIHLSHGDLLDPADRGYRLLRRCLRSRPAKGLFGVLPPDWTWAMARRADSLNARRGPPPCARRVERLLEDHAQRRFAEGYAAVVTGHFHHPYFREDAAGTVIGLGDWIAQYSYAVWENGRFELRSLDG